MVARDFDGLWRFILPLPTSGDEPMELLGEKWLEATRRHAVLGMNGKGGTQ